ncbi:MAG TPA: DUF1810 family protein [Methylomirabilota bacterium]|nr:DUF1810 family protein [Methylomirabilota bacterium]
MAEMLQRFREAQDRPHAGFQAALRELQAGRKTGHWIWYIFPQLAGLGRSTTAVHYGLAGAEEAAAYLRDAVLGERLTAAAAAVASHLGDTAHPVPLATVMGAEIDALKLVSSMTLFRHVARALHAADPQPRFATLAGHADAILAAAARQGYPPCAYTEAELRGRRA